jgi:hypothetical protein
MSIGPREGIASSAIFDGNRFIGHIIRPQKNPTAYRAIYRDYKHTDCTTYNEAIQALAERDQHMNHKQRKPA